MAAENGSSRELSRLISRSLILRPVGKYSTEQAKNKTLVSDILHRSADGFQVFWGGSMAEGTGTPGSDSDQMCVVLDMIVTTSEINKGDSEGEFDIFLLDVSNSNPGYARLRLITKSNKKSSLFACSNMSLQEALEETNEGLFLPSGMIVSSIVDNLNKRGNYVEQFCHGPCVTANHVNPFGLREGNQYFFSIATDVVFAIACREWPYETNSWITRKRPHNWPSQALIERIRGKKCHVVPIGNPQSDQCALEWRVSYLLSERELVWSFNDTQLHCFFLLKILLKNFLETIAPDQLSSYNMKTLLFWLSEEKGLSMWYPENLIICLEMCLDKLYESVKQKQLQHYFNCHANLLGHKFQNDLQQKQILKIILEIKTNIIPILLAFFSQEWQWPRLWEKESSETFNIAKISRCTDYYKLETNFVTYKQEVEVIQHYNSMLNLLIDVTSKWQTNSYLLTRFVDINRDKFEGVELPFILTTKLWLDFRFAMAYFRQITIHDDEDFQKFIDSSSFTVATVMEMVSLARMIDVMSGELNLATVFHFLGDYIRSTVIVISLLKKRMYLVYPGICSTYGTIHLTGGGFAKQEDGTNFLYTDGITYPAYDVIFSHKDIFCVPYPVQFECAMSGFGEGANIVTIHPCVYAYFLLGYGQYISKDFAGFRNNLVYLERTVNETKGGVSRYHALNILSYCHVLDGNLQKAFEYFTESLIITEKMGYIWNAAAIHIAIIVLKRLEK